MAGHPKELLDVVDDNDVVVGQAGREQIHEQGLPHRAIHLILVSPKRYFLLQRRRDDRPTYPHRWDSSASGHVCAGETYAAAAKREAVEEIGFPLPDPIPVLALEASAETDNEWIQFFVQEVQSPPRLQPDQEEVEELRWWSEADLVGALVKEPEQFTPAFVVLFFLWRQTGFVIPSRLPDGWCLIVEDSSDRAEVQRALLESSGLRARINGRDRWVDPQPGRSIFTPGPRPRREGLCVPPEEVPEAVALLFLSHPLEEDAAFSPP